MKPPRCRVGLRFAFEDYFARTRCRLKPGHNGPHKGRHVRSMPYHEVKWFYGDKREFQSDRDIDFAWRAKK